MLPIYDHALAPIFFLFIPSNETSTKAMPRTTIVNSPRLKSSGSKSNPLEGANLVKKTSGPPKASINDCDSTFAVADEIDLTFDTS